MSGETAGSEVNVSHISSLKLTSQWCSKLAHSVSVPEKWAARRRPLRGQWEPSGTVMDDEFDVTSTDRPCGHRNCELVFREPEYD